MSATTSRAPRATRDAFGWRQYPTGTGWWLVVLPGVDRLYLRSGRNFIPVEPHRYALDGTREGERRAVARFLADARKAESAPE